MDKKQLTWIILLAVGMALLLPRLMSKEPPPPPPATQPAAAVAESAGRWNYGGQGLSQEDLLRGRIPRVLLGSLRKEDGYLFQAEIDPRGASIHTLKLTGHFQTVQQKRQKHKTPEQLQEWSYPLLNPMTDGAAPMLPFSTQTLRIGAEQREEIPTFASPLTRAPLRGGAEGQAPGRIVWWPVGDKQVAPDGTESVSFALELYPGAQAARPDYRLTKTYSLAKGSSSLRMALKVENLTDRPQRLSVLQNGPVGVPREDPQRDYRNVLTGRYAPEEGRILVPRVLDRETVAKEKRPEGHQEALGDNRPGTAQPVVWAAQANKFFACMALPLARGLAPEAVDAQTPTAALVVPPDQYTYRVLGQVVRESPVSMVPAVVLDIDPVEVAPGAALELAFDVYAGPKDRERLERQLLYGKLNYRAVIQFYSCKFCLVEPLARGVMWVIEVGGKWLGNYGVIIILLVLLVRLLLHPITKRSQVSMMRMQKLGPKMKEIQEKYKDDKGAQQKAMADFFRQTGVTPLLGCLPMFLQMPIWFALWAGLSATASLRHEGLLPAWITDLAAPDVVFRWAPVTLPILGTVSGLHLLPLLLTVFMFLQQKLTPMQSSVTATDEQRRQQKMMMYMTSLMMLVFFYNAPSGLTLYMMASTGAGVLESHVIRKHIRQREASEAAAETRVSLPGWIPRGKRPRKPKGPFGT